MGERDGRTGIAGTDGKERKSGIGSLVTGALGARSADAQGLFGSDSADEDRGNQAGEND